LENNNLKGGTEKEEEKNELVNFLKDTREIILNGVRDAFIDRKTDNIQKLYQLAAKISEELGDIESKKRFENRSKLFNRKNANEILEDIDLTIKSIIQIINYEFQDKIKRVLYTINLLINTAKEIEIAEKTFRRANAQLNFSLIQYIRKMRAFRNELFRLIPKELIQTSFEEWENEHKKIKLNLEKLKVKLDLLILKYKKDYNEELI